MRDGFFQEQVGAELHRLDGMGPVLGVLGADHHDIRGASGGEHRLRGCIPFELRRARGLAPDCLDSPGDRVGPGDEVEAVRHLGGNPRVGAGTRSTTAEG